MSSPLQSSSTSPKTLGIWMTTCLVLGNMIGTGVFFLPASLAGIGPISILGWVATTVGALSLAFVFARLSWILPKSGGPYAYTHDAFGNFPGFLVAWGYWTMVWTSNAAISLAFVSYLAHFFPVLASNNSLSMTVALLVLWVPTVINCFGVQYGGMVQVITVILKMTPLLLVGIFGLFHIDITHFTPYNLSSDSNFSAINAAAALTMWAFIGLESATVPADSVDNPEKTIPRATILGTCLGAFVYILTTIVLFGVVSPEHLANSKAPFVDAANILFGEHITPLIGFCVLASIFGGLNGWIIIQGQMPQALAQDGLFPKIFERTSKNGTPVFGLIISSVLITLLMLFNLNEKIVDQFTLITLVGAVMTLIAYLMACLSSFVILKGANTPSIAFYGAVLLGGVYSVWAILGAGFHILQWCVVGYLISIPIYLWAKLR